ncbi:sulfurtransferase complex subunit TusB [Marinimicrobium sp. C2-29]|uniref:sulfurtransferase complex subunit TusB n=1 Tax=Marinimicrobium sp. C2-29 TaxID=3139825 RepID=UPI00313914AB
MSTLHTVNKSPFEHQTLASCARVCLDGDCVLLLEDGVYGALAARAPTCADLNGLLQRGIAIFALEDDVVARGLTGQLLDTVTLTDYQGFVKLSLEHQTIQSWY